MLFNLLIELSVLRARPCALFYIFRQNSSANKRRPDSAPYEVLSRAPVPTVCHSHTNRLVLPQESSAKQVPTAKDDHVYDSEYFLLREYTLNTVTINPTPCINVNVSSKNNHDKNNATNGIKYNIAPAI